MIRHDEIQRTKAEGRNWKMTSLSDLTSREVEVLQLILKGYTNKAIAAEIFVSRKTVEFHLDRIYTKIGVRTRIMAAIWALQQGLQPEVKTITG